MAIRAPGCDLLCPNGRVPEWWWAMVELRASLKVQALAPGLFAAAARAMGATKPSEELGERQRNKR